MSQSVNLYQMTADDFTRFSADYESYDFKFDDNNSAIFDGNFEGLNFLLSTYYAGEFPEALDELFYPTQFIGEEIDYDAIDIEDPDDFPEPTATYFLSPDLIAQANTLLKAIDGDEVLRLYAADTFNQNDVYPNAWHNDESPDQAFNKRHLAEALNLLRQTIDTADSKGNYIVYFIG